jgi:membrane protein required for colicin V production
MSITLLDGLLIFIVLGSALLAMMRGFLREVLSIGSWIAAAVGTYLLYPTLHPWLLENLGDDLLAKAIAIGGGFLVILLVFSYITMRISDFVIDSTIGPLDRSLGFVFGAARGLLIFVIGMLFLDFFVPVNQPEWVANAKSAPMLDKLGNDLLALLPEDPEKDVIDRLRDTATQLEGSTGSTNTDPSAPGYGQNQQRELERLIDNNSNR